MISSTSTKGVLGGPRSGKEQGQEKKQDCSLCWLQSVVRTAWDNHEIVKMNEKKHENIKKIPQNKPIIKKKSTKKHHPRSKNPQPTKIKIPPQKTPTEPERLWSQSFFGLRQQRNPPVKIRSFTYIFSAYKKSLFSFSFIPDFMPQRF